MTALREAVARAISETTLDWGDEEAEIWDTHRFYADAALAAIRAALTQAEAERDKGRTALRYLVWSVWIDHPSTQDIINMDAFDCARAALGDHA